MVSVYGQVKQRSTTFPARQIIKGGKGDVLADISKACTEHDMDMGLYLSPWDIHDESYGYKDASGKALVEFVDTNNDGKPDKNQPVTV